MDILLASDSHGRTSRLHELESIPADQYLFAGDLCDDPSSIEKWTAVAGNNDQYLHIDLPEAAIIPAEGHQILLVHGHQFPASVRKKKLAALAGAYGCDIVVYGHSHVPDMDQVDDVVLLNPGSVFRSRDGEGPSYMMLHLDKDKAGAELVRKEFQK